MSFYSITNPSDYYNFNIVQSCIGDKQFTLLVPTRKSVEEIKVIDIQHQLIKNYDKYCKNFVEGVKQLCTLLEKEDKINLTFYCASKNDIKAIKTMLWSFAGKFSKVGTKTQAMKRDIWICKEHIYNFVYILDYNKKKKKTESTHVIVTYIPTQVKKKDNKKIMRNINKIQSNTTNANIWLYVFGKWVRGSEYHKLLENTISPTKKLQEILISNGKY